MNYQKAWEYLKEWIKWNEGHIVSESQIKSITGMMKELEYYIPDTNEDISDKTHWNDKEKFKHIKSCPEGHEQPCWYCMESDSELCSDGLCEDSNYFITRCDKFKMIWDLDCWHNPDGLTPEQVGVKDGWRLLLKSEIMPRVLLMVGGCWSKSNTTWYGGEVRGDSIKKTYRTKLHIGELDTKEEPTGVVHKKFHEQTVKELNTRIDALEEVSLGDHNLIRCLREKMQELYDNIEQKKSSIELLTEQVRLLSCTQDAIFKKNESIRKENDELKSRISILDKEV